MCSYITLLHYCYLSMIGIYRVSKKLNAFHIQISRELITGICLFQARNWLSISREALLKNLAKERSLS